MSHLTFHWEKLGCHGYSLRNFNPGVCWFCNVLCQMSKKSLETGECIKKNRRRGYSRRVKFEQHKTAMMSNNIFNKTNNLWIHNNITKRERWTPTIECQLADVEGWEFMMGPLYSQLYNLGKCYKAEWILLYSLKPLSEYYCNTFMCVLSWSQISVCFVLNTKENT